MDENLIFQAPRPPQRIDSYRMSREKPMHKVADRVVGFWPESQVKVIAEQAKSDQANWKSRSSLRQEAEERLIISIAVKDLGAAVAPVEDVVTDAANGGSCGSWHARTLATRGPPVNNKHDCPLFCPLTPPVPSR